MADVRYSVEVQYFAKGNINQKLGDSHTKLANLQKAAETVGSSLGNAFGSVLATVESVGLSMAKWGAGTVLAGVTYGVVAVNAELEDTKIALATIFKGNGLTSTFNDGLTLAASTMKEMRKDAAQLPGEFSDLTNIFQSISTAGIKAGMDSKQLEKFAANTMVAAAVSKVSYQVAGQEMAAILEGRATNRMPLVAKLPGFKTDAKTLNQMSQPKRLEVLNKALEGLGDAKEAYQHAFKSLFSTVKDELKRYLGEATMPVFESIKVQLEHMTGWFNAHRDKVQYWAQSIGSYLRGAFEGVVDTIQKWTPHIEKLLKLLKDHHPTVGGIAGSLALTAIAPKAIGAVGSFGETAGYLSRGVSAAGGIGALGPAAIAVGAAAAVASVELLAMYGAIQSIIDKSWDLNARAEELGKSIMGHLGNASAALSKAWSSIQPLVDLLGTLFLENINTAAKGIEILSENLAYLFEKIQPFIKYIGLNTETYGHSKDLRFTGQDLLHRENNPEPGKPPVPVPTNHTTHIHRVEITVASNQDPSRIARRVKEDLLNLAINPKQSRTPTQPNFTGPR